MKQKLAQYILFVYEHYIKEDWSVLTTLGKVILYPFWLIRIPIVTLYSIFCFPLVLLHMIIADIDITPIIFEIENILSKNPH